MCPEASVGMTIGITGSSGLVGSALVRRLVADGNRVVPLRRHPDKGTELFFPAAENRTAPVSFDAVVHLAGEPIVGGRWNAAKKGRIRDSRVEGTRVLCQELAEQIPPPRVLLCASA